ncbi:hypothetical protein C8J57DRAFT_1221176 [Mycena rebaudengoi]|nr:hypothetical protein C8J57DRAFT_1221176 [Mycena rebaudengoi]
MHPRSLEWIEVKAQVSRPSVGNGKACASSRLLLVIEYHMLQPSIQRTGPTTEALARRIRRAHSQDHQLAFGMPVTVIIWMFDESNPTQIILYPREDGRLRLADNAEAICAEDGWEDYDTGFFELWMLNERGLGTWEKARWNTPLSVPMGNSLLIRDLGVTEMRDFDIYEHHILATVGPHRIKATKAKHRFDKARHYDGSGIQPRYTSYSTRSRASQTRFRKRLPSRFWHTSDRDSLDVDEQKLQGVKAPSEIILYPRKDRRLLMVDHITINDSEEWEDTFFRSWLKIKWSTPVKAPENNTLLIRDMGVTDSDMDDLEIYQQHLHIISPATLPPHRQDLTPGQSHGSLTSVGITRYMTVWSVISSAPQEASGMPDRQSLKPPQSVSAVSRTITAQLSLRTRGPVLTAGLTEHLPRNGVGISPLILSIAALNGKSDADLVKGENYQIVDMRVFTSGRIIKIVSYDVACQYTKKIVPYVGLLSQHLGEMAGIEIDSVVSEIPELVEV